MIDWQLISIALIFLGAILISLRFIGQFANQRLATLELDEVINSDEYKVRGRFE